MNPAMTKIIEAQIARTDGTVLRSTLAPEGASVTFEPEAPGFEIRGEFVTRYRILPDGEWIVTARYPDGWLSNPEIPAEAPGEGL